MSSSVDVRNAAPVRLLRPEGRRHPKTDEVIDVGSIAGLDLFDWQAENLADAMRLSDGGRWAAREVAVIVGRQNGKNGELAVRQLGGLFVLKERLQIHSAHEFKTCYEHFRLVKDLIENTPMLADQVAIIRTGAGDQAIELVDGCRIRFIARSRTSGRGFSADVVYLDEAFDLDDHTMGALLPTLSARPNPQIWYTSSAPFANSTVLHRVRKRALESGDTEPRLLFAEWGNDPDTDPLDREAWGRANPSLGLLIDVDDVETEQRSMAPEEFARERLGIPDEPLEDQRAGPISGERWAELVDGDSLPTDETLRLALDVPPDRTSATFAVAGKRADGLTHVSVRYHVAPPEMRQLVKMAADFAAGHNTPLILPPNSPAKSWKADLVAAGVTLDELTPAEYAEACGAIQAKVLDGALRHRSQPELDNAVGGLAARTSGDVETWSRRSSKANIAPFVAATCALVRVPDVTEQPFDGDYFVDLDDLED